MARAQRDLRVVQGEGEPRVFLMALVLLLGIAVEADGEDRFADVGVGQAAGIDQLVEFLEIV